MDAKIYSWQNFGQAYFRTKPIWLLNAKIAQNFKIKRFAIQQTLTKNTITKNTKYNQKNSSISIKNNIPLK
jgi:hypothetical protein